MSDQAKAELVAAVVVVGITLILWWIRRPVWVVTADMLSYAGEGGVQRALGKGTYVPSGEVGKALEQGQGAVKQVTRSALYAILVGRDNRVSTSKTVVFAWTMAIAFALIALLAADGFGDNRGWDELNKGLQEEYLLLLGGPFAAAVLAKTRAVAQSETEGKPSAPPGTESPTQLVTDDEGNADLGDFQYLLFNAIALAYFFGRFIGNLPLGFPDLPPLLAGLVLTSAGGYAAKKLVQQARPTLTSVVPAQGGQGTEAVQIYGRNLLVPASVSPSGADMLPTVSVGMKPATITAHEQLLGADRLTVTVPQQAAVGAGTISVVRADGIPALGPAGSDGVTFTVT